MKFSFVIAVIFFSSTLDTTKKMSRLTDVLQDPIFLRFMTLATDRRLQVLVSLRCLQDHGPDIRHFLRRLPFPAQLSTERRQCSNEGYCYNISLQANSLLHIWCEHYDMTRDVTRLPFKNVFALLSDDVRDKILTVNDSAFFRDPSYEFLQFRGVYCVFQSEGRIMLTKDSEVECLSCGGSPFATNSFPRLLRQLPLKEIELTVICLHPSFCDHPSYPILLQIFDYKNASFCEKRYTLLE